MCGGDNPVELINQFEKECDGISQEQVSGIFSQLDREGLAFQSNPRVVDFYHGVLTKKMSADQLNQFAPGHPVRVYLEENILLRSLFNEIGKLDPVQDARQFRKLFREISKVEKHYVRKENQLFPCLEKHGWDSPSKNMWAFHDDIRASLKEVRLALAEGDMKLAGQRLYTSRGEMERLMSVEEERLLPNAMGMLEEHEWQEMRTGDEEIGWMLDEAPPPYPAPEAPAEIEQTDDHANQKAEVEYIHPSKDTERRDLPFSTEDKSHFDEGYLTVEQVNLMFRTLPLDITYVDENDHVVFYNRGEERLFPRSAGIIGREVRYCHPPKSVDTVLRILEEFKKGTQDVANFRINYKGRFVLIQYFAVRDAEKNYRGVLEMSQDITDIKAMEGEQRLLDWD
jgi:PAS domain S-box-containing protein